MNCLYVFVDESGNLDFSPKGTTHYVMAAVTAESPIDSSIALQNLKYHLLAHNTGGLEYQHFHASEDKQSVRDLVIEKIGAMKNIRVNYIIAEKRRTHPSFQNAKFYSLLGSALVKYLLKVHKNSPYEKVIVVFDQALSRAEQDSFLKTAKPVLKAIGKPYAIYFHRTMSDFNGQIADYCAWAKFVSLERAEMRPLKALSLVPSETFDIFHAGHTYYY
jgi:hypothetical protein